MWSYFSGMITIYGIKNCDTMQKALKWLVAHGIEYRFHDYKESGIDRSTLEYWLKHLPLNKLVNLRSTTYKDLTNAEKEDVAMPESAITLMLKYNSIIKRPVWDLGNDKLYLGWDEKEISRLLLK